MPRALQHHFSSSSSEAPSETREDKLRLDQCLAAAWIASSLRPLSCGDEMTHKAEWFSSGEKTDT